MKIQPQTPIYRRTAPDDEPVAQSIYRIGGNAGSVRLTILQRTTETLLKKLRLK